MTGFSDDELGVFATEGWQWEQWKKQLAAYKKRQAEIDVMFARNMDDEDVREVYIEDTVAEFEKRAVEDSFGIDEFGKDVWRR